MDILGTIVSGGLGLLTGGVTGLLGVGVQRFFDFLAQREARKTLEQQNLHALALKKADAEILEKEFAGRVRVAEVEAAGRRDVAEADAFARSFDLEPRSYAGDLQPPKGGKVAKAVHGLGWLLMVVLDTLRGVIRPGLTLYLAWVATRIYQQAETALAFLNDGERVKVLGDVYQAVVFTLLYLFTTVVLWWFGTRNSQKPPKIA